METKFNFNSQICTTKEQSERLLTLGLKKETADCHWCYSNEKWKMGEGCNSIACVYLYPKYYIPAWSLHRLIEMMPKTIGRYFQYTCNDSCGYMDEDALNMNGGFDEGNIYDSVISCIEWLIKEGYFNKEYLCEK